MARSRHGQAAIRSDPTGTRAIPDVGVDFACGSISTFWLWNIYADGVRIAFQLVGPAGVSERNRTASERTPTYQVIVTFIYALLSYAI